jgi:anthranilate synthase component 2
VHHNGEGVFAGLPTPFNATRYHSLVVASQSLPNCLCVTSWTLNDQGHREEVMGFRHLELDVEGVQFHPESIESEHGHALLKSFLDRCLAAQ